MGGDRFKHFRFHRKSLEHLSLDRVYLEKLLEAIERGLKQFNPTLGLQILFSFLWFVLLVAAFGLYQFPPYMLIPIMLLQSLLVFLMFTPLHDSAHFIGSRNRVVNEMMLYFCWPIFLGNPILFRRIHIQHHARVNDGKMDPDHFTAGPNVPIQIFRSFFLIFYYHFYAIRNWRSWRWRAHIASSIALPLLLLNLALITPFTWSILLAWILPAWIGIGLLAFANTAWPHHPAKSLNKYLNTRNTYVPWALQLLMLNQNLHHVHHLKPNLPWYQYPEYWREHQDEVFKNGGQVRVHTRRQEAYALIPDRVLRLIKQIRESLEIALR